MDILDGGVIEPGQTPLYTAEQVRELDRRAIAGESDGFALMHRASGVAWRWLKARWPATKSLTVFCGGGNNGGDGHVLAALAATEGRQVQRISLTPRERLKGDALRAAEMADDAGVGFIEWREGLRVEGDVVVDAMLGTGFAGDLRPTYAAAIAAINESRCPVLAVDIPSGITADGGAEPSMAVRAVMTVTFIADKLGLHTGRGAALAGEVVVESLGVDALAHDDITPTAWRLQSSLVNLALPPRERDMHKGAAGFAGIFGGAPGFGGAALLAAEACARVGAGRVLLATAPEHVGASLVRCPEVMARGVTHASELDELLDRLSVLAVGPGLGQGSWGQSVLQTALKRSIPLVLDADALNLLVSRFADQRRDDWILTPHPGEAARLLETSVAEVEADRPGAARALQQRWGGVVVLKGAGTLIAGPEGLALCPFGNPGMASGGMGDTLTGVLAGLMAQGQAPGWSLERTARLGVLVHALAGDMAAREGGERGLLASDLASCARKLVNPTMGEEDAAATR
ncbi:NAD(P)H-hydrate dehydratase [Halomonas sp. DN3]|uniref:NAD(P)H-hydrate dehydratase n=1 Tax=Halomonas sp. DN3 TaxID=2953657 RepID=UPI00209F6899|nr:NAD(P)H-hydrate dehydratase [Halomonas sp. DN3]USZ50852.1 NAD(P)H-hydrate dehydratase [Halomonas sp. DN3]